MYLSMYLCRQIYTYLALVFSIVALPHFCPPPTNPFAAAQIVVFAHKTQLKTPTFVNILHFYTKNLYICLSAS